MKLPKLLRPGLSWFLFSLSGCLSSTPFQSARVAESGRQSTSVSLQKSFDPTWGKNDSWYMMEFGGRIPVVDGKVDFGLNGSFMLMETREGLRGGGAMLGLGPKFEIVPDILAVEVPARFTFAGAATFHTTHFYPRAILSLPVTDLLELNLSYTRFLFTWENNRVPYACAAGLAIGRRGGFIVRPEVGVLVYPDGVNVLQFGIALTPEGPLAKKEKPLAMEAPF